MKGYFVQNKVCYDLHGKPTMHIIVKVDKEFWHKFSHDHKKLSFREMKQYISKNSMRGLHGYLYDDLMSRSITTWFTN